MLEQESAEFRQSLQTCARNASGHAPRELRVRGARLAAQMLEGGEPVTRVAKALGISVPTVRQWTSAALGKHEETPVTLVPVEVAERPREATSKRRSAERRVSVIAPSGYRVDGLSIGEAATLLRALR
jgi:transposase-like protein